MAFFEITVTGYKRFIVEADSESEALNSDVVEDEMGGMGDIDWEADTANATPEATPDLDQCKRHGVKVFDKNGIEYSA